MLKAKLASASKPKKSSKKNPNIVQQPEQKITLNGVILFFGSIY